jgi:hypothetical protein
MLFHELFTWFTISKFINVNELINGCITQGDENLLPDW